MRPTQEHPTEKVKLGGLGLVDVDIEIVDLVVALCELGWLTRGSCQDNVDDRVWISFWHSNWASRFMELIVNNGGKELRYCVANATTEEYDKVPNRWKWKNRWWVDSFVEGLDREGEPSGAINIRISVRFPRKHLKTVTRIVLTERDERFGPKGPR